MWTMNSKIRPNVETTSKGALRRTNLRVYSLQQPGSCRFFAILTNLIHPDEIKQIFSLIFYLQQISLWRSRVWSLCIWPSIFLLFPAVVCHAPDQLWVMARQSRVDVVSFPHQMADHRVQPAVCLLCPDQPAGPLPLVSHLLSSPCSEHTSSSWVFYKLNLSSFKYLER